VTKIPLPENNSYDQILKSTTLVGGSQVVNIIIGIVRTKFMAVLLGPAGIGIMGMYMALTGLVGTASSLGIGSSGVRQIAESAGTGDKIRISRTIITLRRVALFLGIVGMALTIALSGVLSRLTFGDSEHSVAIAALSVILLFGAINSGQIALIQGLRRIGDLALTGVLGAFLGAACSIPMIYVWGHQGIVPALIMVSVMTILPSWWYARKIPVAPSTMTVMAVWKEARALLSLGLVFMATGVMTTAVLFLARVLVTRQLGMESVGYYLAATTLSSLYVGMILNAMGMDFYPRLTAVANDNPTCNRLVNEQTEVGLLMATPGILATLTFAPFVISLFYTAQFIAAYEILRWQILGVFIRVVCWPMGYVIMAKGRGKVLFCTELIANCTHIALLWVGLSLFGLAGTGIAFFLLYVFYIILIFVVVHHISGFNWTTINLRLNGIFILVIAFVFLLPFFLPGNFALAVNAVVTLAVSVYSLKKLYKLVGQARFAGFIGKLGNKLRLIGGK